MNNSKRLLAIILSVFMMISMISCYTFTVSADEPENMVGANPTAEHIPLVDLAATDVYVVDAEMTEGNGDLYTLEWDDIPDSEPRTEAFYVGTNAFKTVDDAIIAANGDGNSYPTILIKSLGAPKNGITDCYFNIKSPAKYYTEAYRTMPYVVGDKPEDAWTKNIEFESRAIKLLRLDFYAIQSDCDVEVAGFEVVDVPDSQAGDYSASYGGGCINLINRSDTYVQNFKLVNICINTLDYTNPDEAVFVFPQDRDKAYLGTIELDNLYVQSVTANKIFKNTQYNVRPYQVAPFEKLVIDGLYFNSIDLSKITDQWLDIRGKDASFTLKNANLSNIVIDSGEFFRIGCYNYDREDAEVFYINGSTGATKDTNHVLNISNNTFVGTVATTGGAKAPVSVTDGMWNEFIFQNNYVNNINHIEDYQLFGYWNVNERYTMHNEKYPDNATPVATISGNKIIGVSTSKFARTPAPTSVPDMRWTVQISENYYTPGFDATVEGVPFDMPENDAQAESYYTDADMTELVGSSSYALQVAINVAGEAVSKDSNGVYNTIVAKDYANDIPIVVTPKNADATAVVYLASDLDKTPVTNAQCAAAQTAIYFIEVSNGEDSVVYTLNISREGANWGDFDAVIAMAKNMATDEYCPATVALLNQAVETAESLDRVFATQDDVDQAAYDVEMAIYGLLPHEFSNYVYNGDATCGNGGTKTAYCNLGCGETDTKNDPSHPATGLHDYESTVTKPTCTDEGYTTHTCKVCGSSYIDNKTEAVGHDYEEEVIVPTCTDDGYTIYTCKVCGDLFVDNEVKAFGHDFGEWVVTKPATEQEEGLETRVCKNDPTHVETRPIPKLAPQVEFIDVPAGAFFAEPVQWAVANKVTNGTGANTFSPNNTCTRGQVVTFLWRAAGQNEPTSTVNPFTDVKESDYFYKAVLWAVEKNITSGTSATTFSPSSQCTRGQVVTFLWRAKGQVAPKGTTHSFTDIQNGAYYYSAVLWAVENNITSGTSATTFSPNNTCTRGQVVTFLYRAFK